MQRKFCLRSAVVANPFVQNSAKFGLSIYLIDKKSPSENDENLQVGDNFPQKEKKENLQVRDDFPIEEGIHFNADNEGEMQILLLFLALTYKKEL